MFYFLHKNRNIAYLDSGATTQKPQYVIDAIDEFYEHNNANPHRGAYSLSIDATNVYEGTREKIAKFINARKANEIIFSKNASESLNLIAYSYGLDNLKKDDEVVLSIMEHHSNLVPWQYVTKKTGASLKYMYINDEFELSKEEIESKITDKTRIVGITHVSNVRGTINNVKEIIKYAHKKGAVVIVDASQSIPHMKIDVQDLDADFVVFSGHKMFAPLGIGVLYGKEKLLNNMNPFLMGGDMIEYVYEQDTTFAPLPNKFEAVTQNVEGVIGLGSAIDYIEKIGYKEIQNVEEAITKYAVNELSKLDLLYYILSGFSSAERPIFEGKSHNLFHLRPGRLGLPDKDAVGTIIFSVLRVHCARRALRPAPPGRGGGARPLWIAAQRCGSGRGPWRLRRAGR